MVGRLLDIGRGYAVDYAVVLAISYRGRRLQLEPKPARSALVSKFNIGPSINS